MDRRTLLRGAAAAADATAFGGTLAACGSTKPDASSGVVTHWDYFVSQAPWLDNEIKLFQQKEPHHQDQEDDAGQRAVRQSGIAGVL